MRIARGLVVDDVEGGGVRVVARDWPNAARYAAVLFAAGVPLALWSLRGRHWVELGGALLFCAFGAACLALSAAQRRDFELLVGLDGVSLAGSRGSWRFERMVAQDIPSPIHLEVRAFARPYGAPELPHAGGDLVLVAENVEVVLARRTGAGWRATLESARDEMRKRLPDLL